jgi:hypothetical protein
VDSFFFSGMLKIQAVDLSSDLHSVYILCTYTDSTLAEARCSGFQPLSLDLRCQCWNAHGVALVIPYSKGSHIPPYEPNRFFLHRREPSSRENLPTSATAVSNLLAIDFEGCTAQSRKTFCSMQIQLRSIQNVSNLQIFGKEKPQVIESNWLRGKDLNLRPLGYERAGQWLCSS